MSVFPPTLSKSLTSTPLKSKPIGVYRSKSVESTDDSTYSLLSPIYHDSYEGSDDELAIEQLHARQPVLEQLQKRLDDLRTSSDDASPAVPQRNGKITTQRKVAEVRTLKSSTSLQNLSAWEQWLVTKTQEQRFKLEQKALEESALQEKKEQEEREKQQKKVQSEDRIQEWLKLKTLKEKQEKECKERQKQTEQERERRKRRETELKAQEKYKEWLLKKKQEEEERKLREQEEAAFQEAEEKERRRRAEEKFQEWLRTQNRSRPKSNTSGPRGYDNLNYPSPSFYNPVPWKPVPIPPPEKPLRRKTPRPKSLGPPRHQSTPCLTYRFKDTLSFASKRR